MCINKRLSINGDILKDAISKPASKMIPYMQACACYRHSYVVICAKSKLYIIFFQCAKRFKVHNSRW